jgi:hypothetical protein
MAVYNLTKKQKGVSGQRITSLDGGDSLVMKIQEQRIEKLEKQLDEIKNLLLKQNNEKDTQKS